MENTQKKLRQSNFELLRILAMMGIIAYHLVLHHINYDRFALMQPEVGSNFWHLDVIQIFYNFGQIGNTLFILITGYFLIQKKEINILKPAGKLVNRTYMTAILLLAAAYLFNRYQLPMKTEMDIDMSLEGWWFIGYYIFIITFAKYVLNGFLQRISKREFFSYLTISVILLGFMEIFNIFKNLKMDNLAIGIVVYSVGAFIGLYQPLKKVRVRSLFLFLVVFFLIQVIQYKVNLQMVTQDFVNKKAINVFYPDPFTNTLWSPSILFLMCSVTIFELFRRFKIGSIPLINRISASVFTVYLFHESDFFREMLVKGMTLPNRLGILKNSGNIIIKGGSEKGTALPLTDPETWLELPDFLNISQVFQERGVKLAVLYMFFLTLSIFVIGLLLDWVIQLLNWGFAKLFKKDLTGLQHQLEE